MKFTRLSLVILVCTLGACANPETNNDNTNNTTATATESTATAVPQEKSKGETLMAMKDCNGCHNKEQKVVGPSYIDIATKYENNATNVTALSVKIIEGGKGVWGEVPMTPHANLSKEDASEMVKYILSLKQ